MKRTDEEEILNESRNDVSTSSETSNEDQVAIQQPDVKIASRKTKLIQFKVPADYMDQNSDMLNSNETSSEYETDRKIGAYSLAVRSKKILKFKMKLLKRRKQCPISKKFSGRSKVAAQKVRVNGKFVKRQEV